MPKNLPEKEPSGTYKNSKLFPENQQQMEHHKLLMVPDHQYFLEILMAGHERHSLSNCPLLRGKIKFRWGMS